MLRTAGPGLEICIVIMLAAIGSRPEKPLATGENQHRNGDRQTEYDRYDRSFKAELASCKKGRTRNFDGEKTR